MQQEITEMLFILLIALFTIIIGYMYYKVQKLEKTTRLLLDGMYLVIQSLTQTSDSMKTFTRFLRDIQAHQDDSNKSEG